MITLKQTGARTISENPRTSGGGCAGEGSGPAGDRGVRSGSGSLVRGGGVKQATLIATVLAVLCPHCGAEQPDPMQGSDKWEPFQLREESGRQLTCVSCDKSFLLHAENRVQVGA